MGKRASNWLFGLASAVFLLFWLLALNSSFPGPSQPKSTIQNASHPKSENESIQDIAAQTVAKYTELLAWFTFILAAASIGNGIFLIRADWAAKRAFDASTAATKVSQELSNKQFLLESNRSDLAEKQHGLLRLQFFAANRPKLEIRFVQRLPDNPHIPASSRRIYVEFSVINTGTSAATITGSRVRLNRFDVDDIPNPDAMGGSADIIPTGLLIVSARQRCNIAIDNGLESSFAEGFAENPDSRLEQAKLILLGWVVYEDERGSEFGTTRTTYFCRAFDPGTGRFAAIPQLADWEFTH